MRVRHAAQRILVMSPRLSQSEPLATLQWTALSMQLCRQPHGLILAWIEDGVNELGLLKRGIGTQVDGMGIRGDEPDPTTTVRTLVGSWDSVCRPSVFSCSTPLREKSYCGRTCHTQARISSFTSGTSLTCRTASKVRKNRSQGVQPTLSFLLTSIQRQGKNV